MLKRTVAKERKMIIVDLRRVQNVLFLALFLLLECTSFAFADPVSDVEYVPVSAEEMAFVNRVADQIKAAVPPLDGWQRNVSVYAFQSTVREGKSFETTTQARNYPLEVRLQIRFRSITGTLKKRVEAKKTAEELQQEMMAAAQSGDMQKVQQIQAQLSALLQGQMAAAMDTSRSAEKPTEFQVQVVVNGEGETIGNTYDFDVPGTTKAFRLDRGKQDYLSYKYYLGDWDVSRFDKKNWKIVSPRSRRNAANHLKSVGVSVIVYGDRETVEAYVRSPLDLQPINHLVED
jgi:hypothetical protein